MLKRTRMLLVVAFGVAAVAMVCCGTAFSARVWFSCNATVTSPLNPIVNGERIIPVYEYYVEGASVATTGSHEWSAQPYYDDGKEEAINGTVNGTTAVSPGDNRYPDSRTHYWPLGNLTLWASNFPTGETDKYGSGLPAGQALRYTVSTWTTCSADVTYAGTTSASASTYFDVVRLCVP